MLKPFSELISLDLTDYISKKPTFKYDRVQGKSVPTGEYLDYLSWADVVMLLYENGAEHVRYDNIPNGQGHPLFLSEGSVPVVRVYVEIDGQRYELTYPVIDGSKDIKMDALVQSDVHNATQRAFVKCVAINTGLGLPLWQKEERQTQAAAPKFDESMHSIQVCIDRVRKKYGFAVSSYGSERDVTDALGLSQNQLKTIFQASRNLAVLESNLDRMA